MRYLILLLLVLLTGCGTVGLPPSTGLVIEGIKTQILNTQSELSQFLQITPPNFEITGLEIKYEELLLWQNLPTYHIAGNYNLMLKLSKERLSQNNNHFDFYLQRQKEKKSWRLAIPKKNHNNQVIWFTYLIPFS